MMGHITPRRARITSAIAALRAVAITIAFAAAPAAAQSPAATAADHQGGVRTAPTGAALILGSGQRERL